MPAGNNNFVDTDAKIKDFLNAVLSSEGIVVDIRRTFINYNGVNRSRVFARRANEMASKGGNEKFVVIALMCYPALQWILQAQDIDRLVEELREQNPDESVSRMSNIQRVLESSLGGCKPQLRLEMRKVFFARCQQLVDAIANVDPGTPVQVDATASKEPSEAPSSGASQADENSEETETNSDITDEVANEHTDADTADETQTVEEDVPKQDESTSETTDTAPSRTVTVTLNKNGGEFEPEWLETANEDPIAAYLGTETNDIVVEDTGDTIVATVTDRDSIDIPVALSSDESLYFTGWDVSSGSYDADSETLTFEDGVDAYVLSAVYSSVVDDDQTLVENRTEFDEQTKRQAIQERLKSSGISTYVLRPSDSYNQLDLVVEGLAFTSDDGLTQPSRVCTSISRKELRFSTPLMKKRLAVTKRKFPKRITLSPSRTHMHPKSST